MFNTDWTSSYQNLRQHLVDHAFYPFGRRPGHGHLLSDSTFLVKTLPSFHSQMDDHLNNGSDICSERRPAPIGPDLLISIINTESASMFFRDSVLHPRGMEMVFTP